MKMFLQLFVFIYLFHSTVSENGNSSMCETCNCTTSVDAKIMTIDCAKRGLRHVGGEWPLKDSTEIIKITFSKNDIPTLEPIQSTNVTIEIVLSNCGITYLIEGVFSDTPNVKFVDLSHNLLNASEIIPEKFEGTKNGTLAIEHLDLSYNQIHSLQQNTFKDMPNLKILNLEGNDFKVLDIHTQLAISSARQLQTLNLANNELTELEAEAIDQHDNLRELDLSKNDLDFVPRSLRDIGKSLQSLKIDENPIFEMDSQTFIGLENLVELSASNLLKLKYVNANTFASMPQLEKLQFCNNLILTDIDREAFGTNQSLKELYLYNNNLYKLDYSLLPWSKLEVFEFNNNPLDCSCDLYNISTSLSKDITRNEDGPYCVDPRTGRYIKVFHLQSDICVFKGKSHFLKQNLESQFSGIRIAVVLLGVTVMLIACSAAVLGIARYRKYQRNMNYPYASSQIAYNRVETNPRF